MYYVIVNGMMAVASVQAAALVFGAAAVSFAGPVVAFLLALDLLVAGAIAPLHLKFDGK